MKLFTKKIIGALFRFLLNVGMYPNLRFILMYHRVADKIPQVLHDPAMYVSSKSFEMHLQELSGVMDIIPLNDIFFNNTTQKRLCAITFDDGWVDNYFNAYPLLIKYNSNATIFLSISFIDGKRRYWFEALYELANSAIQNGSQVEFINYFKMVCPSWQIANISTPGLIDLASNLKRKRPNNIDHDIRGAIESIGVQASKNRCVVTWDEIMQMGNNSISFGSHGLNHYILPLSSKNQKRDEIFLSYDILKNSKCRFTPFFSYPNGDWDKESKAFLFDAGYKGAVTTKLGTFSKKSDPYIIRRVPVHDYISNTRNLFWFRVLQSIMSN